MSLKVKLQKCIGTLNLDLSFEIDNRISILFGPSGAGKSVTLRLMAGLLSPESGDIILKEKYLYSDGLKINLPPQERNIGYVFQKHSLFPHMTISQNILYGLRGFAKKESLDIANFFLNKFNLEKLKSKYPNQISGGEQQICSLLVASIRKPSLLLLDEPFSALDILSKRVMIDHLLTLQSHLQIPTLLVTHDFAEVKAMTSDVMILIDGKIEQRGIPQVIAEDPKSTLIRSLTTPLV